MKKALILASMAMLSVSALAANHIRVPMASVKGAPTSTHPATAKIPVKPEPPTPEPDKPELVLSTVALDFGKQVQGSGRVSRQLTLSNTGKAAASGISFSVTGPYAVSDNACGVALPAGASCQLSVEFAPTGVGKDQVGSLQVAGKSVALSGSLALANYPVLTTLTPVPVSTSMVQNVAVNVTFNVKNTGTSPATITGRTVTGSPDFPTVAFVPPMCRTLQPGASCNLWVLYKPSRLGQVAEAGVIDVSGTSTDEYGVAVPVRSAFSFTATVAAPTYTVLAVAGATAGSPWNLGTLQRGANMTYSVTLVNAGNSYVLVGSPSAEGAEGDAISGGGCSGVVVGGQCDFNFAITGVTPGYRNVTVTLPIQDGSGNAQGYTKLYLTYLVK